VRAATGSQIGLTVSAARNLRGAFAVSDPTRILNRDIFWSICLYHGDYGLGVRAVLLRAGAAGVWVATVHGR